MGAVGESIVGRTFRSTIEVPRLLPASCRRKAGRGVSGELCQEFTTTDLFRFAPYTRATQIGRTNPMTQTLRPLLRRLLSGIVAPALVVALLIPPPAQAQITANIEPFSLGMQKTGWNVKVGANFTMEANDTVLLAIDLDPRVDYVRGKNSVTIVGNAGFTERAGSTVRNQFLLHTRYLRAVGSKTSAEVFTRARRDEFALINSRLSTGTGLRFEITNTEEAATYAGVSLGFQRERLDLGSDADHPTSLNDPRAFGYLAYRQKITDNTTLLNQVRTGLRLGGDFEDVRLTNSATLEVGISENVSLTATFGFGLDSKPPGDQPDVSMSLTNGLTVSL